MSRALVYRGYPTRVEVYHDMLPEDLKALRVAVRHRLGNDAVVYIVEVIIVRKPNETQTR